MVTGMNPAWVGAGVALEVLSGLGYVLAFLQVLDRSMWGTVAFGLLRRSRGEPLTVRPPRAERLRLRREERARREDDVSPSRSRQFLQPGAGQ
jgi:hypothetical protein